MALANILFISISPNVEPLPTLSPKLLITLFLLIFPFLLCITFNCLEITTCQRVLLYSRCAHSQGCKSSTYMNNHQDWIVQLLDRLYHVLVTVIVRDLVELI